MFAAAGRPAQDPSAGRVGAKVRGLGHDPARSESPAPSAAETGGCLSSTKMPVRRSVRTTYRCLPRTLLQPPQQLPPPRAAPELRGWYPWRIPQAPLHSEPADSGERTVPPLGGSSAARSPHPTSRLFLRPCRASTPLLARVRRARPTRRPGSTAATVVPQYQELRSLALRSSLGSV